MHRYLFATAILVCVSFSVSDAFAQRGGRARGGAAQAEDESGQSTGRRARRSGGAAQSDDSPAAPSAGRGRGGRPGGGQSPAGSVGGQGGRFGTGAGGATNPLFAALDADGDGVITRAEMEDAIQAFARLDENKDGKLSKEEAGATGGGGHSHGGGMAGRGGGGRFGGGQGAGGQGGRGRGRMQAAEGSDDAKPNAQPTPAGRKPTPGNAASSKSASPFDE